MNRDDIIRMAREAGCHEASHPMNPWSVTQEALERFARLAFAAGEQAERDRTKRLVEDMQNELQTLRDRIARQKPVLWVYRDNPGLTTMREPGNPDLWEPLGNIV